MPHAALISIILSWLDLKHIVAQIMVAIVSILVVLLPQLFHHKTIDTNKELLLEEMVSSILSTPAFQDMNVLLTLR